MDRGVTGVSVVAAEDDESGSSDVTVVGRTASVDDEDESSVKDLNNESRTRLSESNLDLLFIVR